DPGHDLDVDPLRPREDHGETGCGAAFELAGQIGLEALGVALERDELEPVLRSLTGRQVGPRSHEPHLLLGREAVAQADQCRLAGRALSTSTRSPRYTASSMSWVTKKIVLPVRSQMEVSSSCMVSRVCASSEPNGSSISST